MHVFQGGTTLNKTNLYLQIGYSQPLKSEMQMGSVPDSVTLERDYPEVYIQPAPQILRCSSLLVPCSSLIDGSDYENHLTSLLQSILVFVQYYQYSQFQ